MATTSVLVVEDEDSFVDALTVGLKREGFQVSVARDGAEAIAVGGVRIVPGVVVAGSAGAIGVGDIALPPGFELAAIGAPDKLTGSLTRSGGVIAQFAATQPDIVVTVTPVDRVELPATTRNLAPAHGRPRL